MFHRIALLFMVLALTISPASHPYHLQASDAGSFPQLLNERMPDLLAKYHVPGAVITYIEDGEVAWTQSFGMADARSRKPMTDQMIFNFGSTGKVLTAWGAMRLVEQGKIDLDAPINQYLKRWQIQSTKFDPNQVTLRRLLSHTAGLSVSGFTDYSPRRRLPTLVQMVEGQNQLDGKVEIIQEPGKGFLYSGGGYAIVQMAIEDITGEPFEQFMEREVTVPLGMPGLRWKWSPEMTAGAPVPYGPQGEPLEYRQLAAYAVGSEIATVPEYARFIAAVVSGPNGEAPGRGVLSPDTISAMTTVQPGAEDEGLGYGVTGSSNGKLLQHFGGNDGWTAFFSIDTGSRVGLVVATNSSNGFPFNAAVQNLWLAFQKDGSNTSYEPDPEGSTIPMAGMVVLALAGILALTLIICLVVFLLDLRAGRRVFAREIRWRGFLGTTVLILFSGFWIYWFYTMLPLPFAPAFTDLWRMPQTDVVTGVLAAWIIFSLASGAMPWKGTFRNVVPRDLHNRSVNSN